MEARKSPEGLCGLQLKLNQNLNWNQNLEKHAKRHPRQAFANSVYLVYLVYLAYLAHLAHLALSLVSCCLAKVPTAGRSRAQLTCRFLYTRLRAERGILFALGILRRCDRVF